MLFGQKIHPANFDYARKLRLKGDGVEVTGRSFAARVRCFEIAEFCTKLHFDNGNVDDKRNYSEGVLPEYRSGRKISPQRSPRRVSFSTKSSEIEVGPASLRIQIAGGLLSETAADGFGFNGEQAIFNFNMGQASGFYGFGERTRRFNKSGDSMDFHTVDVVGVFTHHFHRDDYDPAYVSIPLAIIRSKGIYAGLYFDNPERLVMDIGQIAPGQFICESLGGNNDLYLINGPTLRHVVRNFATLTGRAEMPPLWSMGHQQSRWGYKSADEFKRLMDNYHAHDVPVSGFWFDIDYMDEYRVFTWNKRAFPNPAKLNRALKKAGIRAVTIVDPGVKVDSGYAVYENGKKLDAFCKTSSGRDYVGRVWPGDTVFPDFSLEKTRDWWARYLAKFMKDNAVDGAWIDMNDPSTGWSSPDEMCFGGGKIPHAKFHNQYGHLMAEASRRAFEILKKDERPFLLTRSGCTGTQRYSAIWTGDNCSSWEHLRMSIPCTINLGLSGVAFNGPDVGGFMGNTTAELLARWYQAGFLFPFFRNHTEVNTKSQEPWEFGPVALAQIRDAVYTRYRLMPYLYNCFFQHHLHGDPVLRPLLYEFEGDEFEDLDDQFLVGESIMVAPILEPANMRNTTVQAGARRQVRQIVFPKGWWFDLIHGKWIEGGRTVKFTVGADEVPMFVREGAIIPWYNGRFRNSEMPLKKIELHVFARERAAKLAYFIDDRVTRKYLKGIFNTAHITANARHHEVQIEIVETGKYPAGTIDFTPVIYGREGASNITIVENNSRRKVSQKPSTRRWVGRDVRVLA